MLFLNHIIKCKRQIITLILLCDVIFLLPLIGCLNKNLEKVIKSSPSTKLDILILKAMIFYILLEIENAS